MFGAKMIIPVITGLVTYFDGLPEFGFIPDYLERPFQAFFGAFLSSAALAAISGATFDSKFWKGLAEVGGAAALGAFVGGAAGGLLGFGNVPMTAAFGAAYGAYMLQ